MDSFILFISIIIFLLIIALFWTGYCLFVERLVFKHIAFLKDLRRQIKVRNKIFPEQFTKELINKMKEIEKYESYIINEDIDITVFYFELKEYIKKQT